MLHRIGIRSTVRTLKPAATTSAIPSPLVGEGFAAYERSELEAKGEGAGLAA